MSKHTKAPWIVYKGAINMEGGLNPFFRGIVALLKHSGEDDDIAVILDRDEPAHDFEANGCLMAAAPELLTALLERCPRCRDGMAFGTNEHVIRVVSAASGHSIAYHQTEETPRLPCLLTQPERDAIAKARGTS